VTKREQQLIDELRDRYTCRECGGVHYPRDWMTKTREGLMLRAALVAVPCALVQANSIALRIAA
jgi:NMD protein affecting ribosome stability and mRNA decay